MSGTGGSELWWVQRWLDPIVDCKELRVKVRKGRVVARRGRVSNLTVRKGLVTASVGEESGGMCSVRLRQAPVHASTWDTALERIAGEAALSAMLLGGRISEDIVHVFAELGADLFPFDHHDLTYFCTCPDNGAMCVHAVAVHIVLGQAIGADPLVLLEFRGRARDELLSALRERQSDVLEDGAEDGAARDEDTEAPEGLIDGYWEAGIMPRLAFRLSVVEADRDEVLPVVRALGPGPAQTPPEVIADVLAPIMRMARKRLGEVVERVMEEDELPANVNATSAASLDEVLVAAAYQHGSLTSALVSQALGVSQLEARRYLKWLVEEGRLMKVGRARGTRYVPSQAAPAPV